METIFTKYSKFALVTCGVVGASATLYFKVLKKSGNTKNVVANECATERSSCATRKEAPISKDDFLKPFYERIAVLDTGTILSEVVKRKPASTALSIHLDKLTESLESIEGPIEESTDMLQQMYRDIGENRSEDSFRELLLAGIAHILGCAFCSLEKVRFFPFPFFSLNYEIECSGMMQTRILEFRSSIFKIGSALRPGICFFLT